MAFHFQLAVLLLSLIAGAITIFLSNRLTRRYSGRYLSSYFYFLVFSYIFGVYSIVGSGVISFYLSHQEVASETIISANRFLVALGFPFLVLAWYMFFRLSREMFRKELHWIFMVSYFAIYLLLFMIFILLGFRIIPGLEIRFMNHPLILPLVFSVTALINFGATCIYMIIRVREINDHYQRKAFRWFSAWYLVYALLVVSLVNLAVEISWMRFPFVGVLLGFHIIPVLFLNNYLHLHYVPGVESQNFSERLEAVVLKYQISKREKEIIELICKGMTNQQISDSLFISLQTVKDHVHRIFIKTGVKNRVQLSNLLED